MTGFFGNIEKETEKNKYFRKVLYTAKNQQLVVMCLQPGEEIGREIHAKVDQFFRIESGKVKFILNDTETHTIGAGGAGVVPMGTWHNVVNASKTEVVKLYTIYTPPNHPDGTVHKTKNDAEAAEKASHH